MIYPFKNRKVAPNKPIEMYRCLNRKGFIFSLRQSGKVVGHTNKIVLKDCDLIVNEAGKRRCIEKRTRNVHAYIRGYLGNIDDIRLEFSHILNYNPYKDMGFNISLFEYKSEITKCKTVYIQENEIYCQI